MIKPYFKHENNAKFVDVEDFGVIDLEQLPIRVREERQGKFEIAWATTIIDGKQVSVLSEVGGRGMMDFGGRELGVIRELDR